MEERKSSLTPIFAVLGGLAGAIAGLLLAPGPGRETREKLKRNYNDLVNDINAIVRNVDEKVPVVMDKVSSIVKETPDKVITEVDYVNKEVSDRVNKVMDRGTELYDVIKKTTISSIDAGKKTYKKEIKKKEGK